MANSNRQAKSLDDEHEAFMRDMRRDELLQQFRDEFPRLIENGSPSAVSGCPRRYTTLLRTNCGMDETEAIRTIWKIEKRIRKELHK